MKYLILTIIGFSALTYFQPIFIIPLTLFASLLIFDRIKNDLIIKVTDDSKKRMDIMQEKLNVIVMKLGIK